MAKVHSPVQVRIGRPLDIQVPLADVIDGFVVNLNTTHRLIEIVTYLSRNI